MTQPTEYEQLSYNAPDGSQWGKASSEPIAFFGGTPSSQSATSTGVHVTTFGATLASQTGVSASGFGASTAAIMTSTFAMVNALAVDMAELQRVMNNMRAIIVRHNFMKGS